MPKLDSTFDYTAHPGGKWKCSCDECRKRRSDSSLIHYHKTKQKRRERINENARNFRERNRESYLRIEKKHNAKPERLLYLHSYRRTEKRRAAGRDYSLVRNRTLRLIARLGRNPTPQEFEFECQRLDKRRKMIEMKHAFEDVRTIIQKSGIPLNGAPRKRSRAERNAIMREAYQKRKSVSH